MFLKNRLIIEYVSPKKQYDYIQWLYEVTKKITKILQIPHSDALYIVEQNALKRVPMVCLVERAKTIKALDIPPLSTSDLVSALYMHTFQLEHRYWLLRDLGVNRITLNDLVTLRSTLHFTGAKFKDYFRMDPKANLVENIFSNLGEYPSNMPSLEKYQDKLSVEETYSHYLLNYKIWKTGVCWSKRFMYYSRPRRSIDLVSFRQIKAVATMLKDEFNVQGNLRKNVYPFFLNTTTGIRVLLSKLPQLKLKGQNVKDILIGNPRILLSCPHNVYDVCKMLEDLGTPTESALNLYKCAEIFIFDSLLVKDRLENFQNDPFLHLWCHHSNVVTMILHYQTVWRNLYILRALNLVQDANAIVLCLSYSALHKYIKGEYLSSATKHVKYLIHGELGVSDNKMYSYFSRHPHWALLTPAHAAEMLLFLKEYFPGEDIYKNIHLILYSREDVVNTLQQLEKHWDMRNYTYSQQLSLCLYLLEKQKCTVAFKETNPYKKKPSCYTKSNEVVTREIENILDTIIPDMAGKMC